MVENSLSFSNTTVFLVIGPSFKDDHTDAVGFMSSLRPGPGTSVSGVWNAPYQAGNGTKPGGWARSSGTSPTLLSNDYTAITDNANTQINLLIFRQDGVGKQDPVCTITLFQPGARATDNGPVSHYDGKDYSVVV